jgi:hypothetical protein
VALTSTLVLVGGDYLPVALTSTLVLVGGD